MNFTHEIKTFFKIVKLELCLCRLRHSRDGDLRVPLHLRQRPPEVSPALPPHREPAGQVQGDGSALRDLRRMRDTN